MGIFTRVGNLLGEKTKLFAISFMDTLMGYNNQQEARRPVPSTINHQPEAALQYVVSIIHHTLLNVYCIYYPS